MSNYNSLQSQLNSKNHKIRELRDIIKERDKTIAKQNNKIASRNATLEKVNKKNKDLQEVIVELREEMGTAGKRKKRNSRKKQNVVNETNSGPGKGKLEKKFSCDWEEGCDFKASFKQSVKRHVQNIHLGVKKYKCAHCDYKVTEKNSLVFHYFTKHRKMADACGLKRKLIKCEECDYIACSEMTIGIHKAKVHNKKEAAPLGRMLCMACDYHTYRKSNYRRHIRKLSAKVVENPTRKMDKPKECDGCTYMANNYHDLIFHMVKNHRNKNPPRKAPPAKR